MQGIILKQQATKVNPNLISFCIVMSGICGINKCNENKIEIFNGCQIRGIFIVSLINYS